MNLSIDIFLNFTRQTLFSIKVFKTYFESEFFQFIPSALQLRFQAELNQMETIQEAERQLNHLDQIRYLFAIDEINIYITLF